MLHWALDSVASAASTLQTAMRASARVLRMMRLMLGSYGSRLVRWCTGGSFCRLVNVVKPLQQLEDLASFRHVNNTSVSKATHTIFIYSLALDGFQISVDTCLFMYNKMLHFNSAGIHWFYESENISFYHNLSLPKCSHTLKYNKNFKNQYFFVLLHPKKSGSKNLCEKVEKWDQKIFLPNHS